MKNKLATMVTLCSLLALPRAARAEDPKVDAPVPRSNLPVYVALGVAGAGVAIGTVYGLTALGAQSDYAKQPTAANADSADRAALVADVAFGVAFASGVTALVLFLSNDRAPQRRSAVVTPMVGPSGGGVAGVLRF